MLPAAAGRLLVRVTVTVCPSVTISVGPGTCMVGQFAPGILVAGGLKRGREAAGAAVSPGVNHLAVGLADVAGLGGQVERGGAGDPRSRSVARAGSEQGQPLPSAMRSSRVIEIALFVCHCTHGCSPN